MWGEKYMKIFASVMGPRGGSRRCPYFVMFLFYGWVNDWLVLNTWLCDKVHIFSFEPISQQSISALHSPGQRAETHLTGRTRLPNKCKERAEKRKAEQQERGQEPGIKRGPPDPHQQNHSQPNRALIVCGRHHWALLFVAPLPPPHTLSFTTASCNEELYSLLLL